MEQDDMPNAARPDTEQAPPRPPASDSPSRKELNLLLFILAVGTLLRTVHLGTASMTYDEVYSLQESRDTTVILFQLGNSMLYSYLLHWWRVAFGDSAAAVRSLSALFGILSLPLVWNCARKLFPGPGPRILAVSLFALVPNAVIHSRDARTYSLWVFFFLLAFNALLNLRQTPASPKNIASYICVHILAMLCHTYMVFYSIGLGFSAFVLMGRAPFRKQRDELLLLFKIHLPLAISWLLLYLRLKFKALDFHSYLTTFLWEDSPSDNFPTLLANLFLRNWVYPLSTSEALCGGIFAALLLCCCWLLLARRATLRQSVLLFSACALPFVLIVLLPIRHYVRLMSPSVPIACMTVGGAVFAFETERQRRIALGAAAALMLMFIVQYPYVFLHEMEPWKEVCERVRAESDRRSALLVNEPKMIQPLLQCFRNEADLYPFPSPTLPVNQVEKLARQYDLVWMVYSHPWTTDRRRQGVKRLKKTGEFRHRTIWMNGIMQLHRFESKHPVKP
jgi:4-amino-4-deoxy-L-arabinose transferase-like glycosyltransferase